MRKEGNPMIEAIEKATRKPLSVVMSVLLAALLVPTVPTTSATAYADDEPGQEGSGTTESEWSPIQGTDKDTGLPTLMVFKNYGFDNKTKEVWSASEGEDAKAHTLDAGIEAISGLTADPSDETTKGDTNAGDAWVKAQAKASESAKNAAEAAIKTSGDGRADAYATSDLNESLSKDDMVSLVANKYVSWYNGELAKDGYGEIGKTLKSNIVKSEKDKGNEISEDEVELGELTKLSVDDDLKATIKSAIIAVSATKSSDDPTVYLDDKKLEVSDYKWDTSKNVTVTSVTGDDKNINATYSSENGSLSVTAQGGEKGSLVVGFNYDKTLTGYSYKISGATYSYDYVGKLSVEDGTELSKTTVSWKKKDNSGKNQGGDASVASADGQNSGEGAGGSDGGDQGGNSGSDGSGEDSQVQPSETVQTITVGIKTSNLSVTADDLSSDDDKQKLNGSTKITDLYASSDESINYADDETPATVTLKNSFTHDVTMIDLFPSTLGTLVIHDDYSGDKNKESLTYSSNPDGEIGYSSNPDGEIGGIFKFEGSDLLSEDQNKANVKEALKTLGDPDKGNGSQDYEDFFSISYDKDNGTLKINALNATYSGVDETTASQTATLKWKNDNGDVIATHEVTVMVNPLEIQCGDLTESYRLPLVNLDSSRHSEAELYSMSQEGHIQADANKAVRDAIAKATEHDVNAVQPGENTDFYEKVTFANKAYKTDGALQQLGVGREDGSQVKMEYHEENATSRKAYGNYKIVDAESVTIEAMKQLGWKDMQQSAWNSDKLVLKAKRGENKNDDVTLDANNCEGTWVNTVPTAGWADHGLNYASNGIPQSESDFGAIGTEVTLNGGQGIHPASIYAIDTDGVISEVTSIQYNLDSIAPRLRSWDVGTPYKTFSGIFFQKDQIDVSFAVTDSWTGKDAGAKLAGETEIVATTSGVNVGATKAEYTDSENNSFKQFGIDDGLNTVSGLSNDDGVAAEGIPAYQFTVEGNQDVASDSICVQAWDNAGNKLDTTAAEAADVIPMEYIRLVSDASDPRINVSWDTYDARHGSYYQTNRTMTITINEEFFNYVQDYANNQVITTVYRDGSEAITVHPTDFSQIGDNTWQYELSFTDDADYVVTDPTIMDIVDRTASVGGDSFTVDKTTPTMEVSFDNNNVVNGKYYQQSRTATITVNEHNFSGDLVNVQPTVSAGNGSTTGSPSVSGWSDNGDVHVATVTFPGEGVYTMTIDGVDLADNALSSYTCEEFIVDTIDPEVDITLNGATAPELSAHKGDATPAVAVHDTNISSDASASGTTIEAIGLSGAGTTTNPYEPTKSMTTSSTDTNINWANPDSSKPENDGVYQMIVTATDLSGRTTTKAVIWSVNRYGSTYRLLDNAVAMSGQYMKYSAGNTTSKVKDVQVEEINPSGIDTSQASVELTKGSNNITLKKGSQYSVEPGTANDDTTGWHTYTYTVNRDNFKDSGRYQVTMHSVDNATNVSENTMSDKDVNRKSSADVSFWVDDVKPVCNIVGVENNKTYEGDSQDVTLTFEDNLKLAGATVEISDGANKTKKEYSADDLKASTTQTVKLNAAGDNQTITVSAIDAADNVSDEVSVSGVYVNSDKFLLWMHNTPLFVGSLVGGAAIIALAIFGILALIRRKNDKDEAQAA